MTKDHTFIIVSTRGYKVMGFYPTLEDAKRASLEYHNAPTIGSYLIYEANEVLRGEVSIKWAD